MRGTPPEREGKRLVDLAKVLRGIAGRLRGLGMGAEAMGVDFIAELCTIQAKLLTEVAPCSHTTSSPSTDADAK